jgi:hypothetical protein
MPEQPRPRQPASAPPVVTLRALGPLVRRPDLWVTGVRTAWLLSAPGWWRRWPPRPRPPQPYEEFRRQTMFGSGPGDQLSGPDLIAYLEWCGRMRRLR